ncbi:MAG: hypothetical protein KC415_08370, partial [Anaerolineales bacterium]|nr:hypothetical protein [Anaerolineales bacterium]
DTIVPDPTNPQSFNRYSYVRNNPVNFTDPTGHRECEFDDYCGPLPPPPLPAGVENKAIPASPFLQEFLDYMSISQSEFNIKVHSNNQPSNPDLYRYEIGAWILIQEQASFHPLNYQEGSANEEYFSLRGLYTSVVLLQVVQSREQNYLQGRINLFEWIQENPQSGQFAYPPDSIKVNPAAIYDDFLILAYLVEQGALPDFLVSYPDTPTSANSSGRPIFYGHYDLVVGVGEYAHGRESLSVSSWAWAQADWIPALEDFYGVIGWE